MSNFTVAIEGLGLMAGRLKSAGQTFNTSVSPALQPAMDGVEWPIIFAGYEAQAKAAHSTVTGVSSRLGQGIEATGVALADVAASYATLERDV